MDITPEKLEEFQKFLETECPEMFKTHFNASLKLQKYNEAQIFMDKIRG